MWQNMKDLLAPYVNASETRPLSILQSANTVPLQGSLHVDGRIHIRHTRVSEFIHDMYVWVAQFIGRKLPRSIVCWARKFFAL